MFARITLASLLLVAAGSAAASEAGHASPEHGKDHGHHHAAAGATLQLDDGAKWQTDAALRKGMEDFQNVLTAAIPAIHDGKLSPAQYAELAGRLEKELHAIMAQCKLAPAADAQFHVLLVEFFGGIETMREEGDRMQGAIRIVRGLGTYGQFFEHPGWKPLVHG